VYNKIISITIKSS